MVRQKRYRKRALRLYKQNPRGAFHLPHGHKHGGLAAKMVVKGNGSKQQWFPAKTEETHVVNPIPPPVAFWNVVVTNHPDSNLLTVKITSGTSLYPDPHGHQKEAFAMVHRRSVKYRGHKIGRRNGADRNNRRATRYWRLSHFDPSQRFWPAWDYLHRTPVG